MNHNHVKLPYFAYIRKSTDTAEKQAMSIESQKQEIVRRFGDTYDIEFVEERRSAFIPNHRPDFDNMLARLESGEKKGLLAWHPDRLSRNEVDAAKVTFAIRKEKILDLQFCSYTFQNSPEGIMMLQMALSQSQYDSAKKGRDVLRQMLQKCERGWFPETAPNGYSNQWSEEYQENIIAVDEVRFPLIRKAIELILTRTHTPPQALRVLNNEWNYKSKRLGKKGGKAIAASTWYAMLSNKFYYGLFDWRDIEYQGKHIPMITPEEFDVLQRLLGDKAKQRPKKHEFAFTGTLKCMTCGFSVTAEKRSKYVKRDSKVNSYTLYHCTHKSKSVECDDRINLNETRLIDQVKARVEPLTIKPLFLEWALDAIEQEQGKKKSTIDPTVEVVAKSLQSSQDELRNFARMFARGHIDEDLYLEEKDRLEKLIANLSKQQVAQSTEHSDDWIEPTRKTFEFATYASARLSSESLDDKRSVLLGLCEQAYLDHGELIAEPEAWFSPIQVWLENNRSEIERIELSELGSESKKKEHLESVRLSWLPRLGSNQRHSR